MPASCRSPSKLKNAMANNTSNNSTPPSTASLSSPTPLDKFPFLADSSPSLRGPPRTPYPLPAKSISSSTTLSHAPRFLQTLMEENDALRFKLLKSKQSGDYLERRIVHQEESFTAYQMEKEKELRWWKSKCHTLAQRLAAEVLDDVPPPLLNPNALSFSVSQNFLSPASDVLCVPSSQKTMRTSEEWPREREGRIVEDPVASGASPTRLHQNFSHLHENGEECRSGGVHGRNAVHSERESSGDDRKDTHDSAANSTSSRRASPPYLSRHSFRPNDEDRGKHKCPFFGHAPSTDHTPHDLHPESPSSKKKAPVSMVSHKKSIDEGERSENEAKHSSAYRTGGVRSTRTSEIISFLLRSQQEERLFALDLLEGMLNDLGIPQKGDHLPSSNVTQGVTPSTTSPFSSAMHSDPHGGDASGIPTAVASASRAQLCALLTRVSLGMRLASAHWIRCLGDWCGQAGEYVGKVEELEETIVEGPLRVLYEDFLAGPPSLFSSANSGMGGPRASAPPFRVRKGGRTEWGSEKNGLAGDISTLSDPTRRTTTTTTTTMAMSSPRMGGTPLFSPSGRIPVDPAEAGVCREEEGSANERAEAACGFSGARWPLSRYPSTSTVLFSLGKSPSLATNGYETLQKGDEGGMDGGANTKNGSANLFPPSFASPAHGGPVSSSFTSLQWCADVLKACVLGLRELKRQLSELCGAMVRQPPLLECSRKKTSSEGTTNAPSASPNAFPPFRSTFSTENLSSTPWKDTPKEHSPPRTPSRASSPPLPHRLSVELMKLQQRSVEVQEKLIRRLERDEVIRLDLITRQQREMQQMRRENVELLVQLSQSTCHRRGSERKDAIDETRAGQRRTRTGKENASLPRCPRCRSHSSSSSSSSSSCVRPVTPERHPSKAKDASATPMSSSESPKEASAKENRNRRKRRVVERAWRRGMQVDHFPSRSPRRRTPLSSVDGKDKESGVRMSGSAFPAIGGRHPHRSHRHPHGSPSRARRCPASHHTMIPHRLSTREAPQINKKRANNPLIQEQQGVLPRRTPAHRTPPVAEEPIKRDAAPLLWPPKRDSLEVPSDDLESPSCSQSTLTSFPFSSTTSMASSVHLSLSSDAFFSSGASSIPSLVSTPPLPPQRTLLYQCGVEEGKRSWRKSKGNYKKRKSGHTKRQTPKHHSSSLAAFSASRPRQAFRSCLEPPLAVERTVIGPSTTHRERVGTHAEREKKTHENTSHCLSWRNESDISPARRSSACSPAEQRRPLAAPHVETEGDENPRWKTIKEAITHMSTHEERATPFTSFREPSLPSSSVWREGNADVETSPEMGVEQMAFATTTTAATPMKDAGGWKVGREEPDELRAPKQKKLLREEKYLVLPQKIATSTVLKESTTKVNEMREIDGRWPSNGVEARKRAPLISPSPFSY